MVMRTQSFELNWLKSSCRRPCLDLVGDISVPQWLKSIRSLSNGQIARVGEGMIPERIYETKESGPKRPGFGLPPEGWGIAKYQIPSTKSQINSKFQYSMTKTDLRIQI
jgi:hypothetical protein